MSAKLRPLGIEGIAKYILTSQVLVQLELT